MNATRLFVAAMLAGSVAVPSGMHTEKGIPVKPMVTSALRLPVEGDLPSFEPAAGWLNSPPLTPAGLKGKVVLVDFCTYSCINWLRQLPYVRAWAAKYKDRGLVVIGVHAPEFTFEKNVDHVRRAISAMGIMYPIVIDNDHAIWRAFENEAWPALYFVDAQGRIRHHYYGEGAYDQAEEILQQLLAEAGHGSDSMELISIEPKGVEATADWRSLRSGENYVGYVRTENFASPGGPAPDKPSVYAVPAQLGLNHWALAGRWTMGPQATVSNAANGRIVYRFHARDLHLVMGAPASGAAIRIRILLDGHAPGAAHGLDVNDQGEGVVKEPRLYQLIRQTGPIVDRTLEIEFLEAGVETFSFTFG